MYLQSDKWTQAFIRFLLLFFFSTVLIQARSDETVFRLFLLIEACVKLFEVYKYMSYKKKNKRFVKQTEHMA